MAGDWPELDTSIRAIRRRDVAFRSARLLVEAHCLGEERSGSID